MSDRAMSECWRRPYDVNPPVMSELFPFLCRGSERGCASSSGNFGFFTTIKWHVVVHSDALFPALPCVKPQVSGAQGIIPAHHAARGDYGDCECPGGVRLHNTCWTSSVRFTNDQSSSTWHLGWARGLQAWQVYLTVDCSIFLVRISLPLVRIYPTIFLQSTILHRVNKETKSCITLRIGHTCLTILSHWSNILQECNSCHQLISVKCTLIECTISLFFILCFCLIFVFRVCTFLYNVSHWAAVISALSRLLYLIIYCIFVSVFTAK